MPDIRALNRRRAEAAAIVQTLGHANQPADLDERLKADARYRLAQDALSRAENEYQTALAVLSTEELAALAK